MLKPSFFFMMLPVLIVLCLFSPTNAQLNITITPNTTIGEWTNVLNTAHTGFTTGFSALFYYSNTFVYWGAGAQGLYSTDGLSSTDLYMQWSTGDGVVGNMVLQYDSMKNLIWMTMAIRVKNLIPTASVNNNPDSIPLDNPNNGQPGINVGTMNAYSITCSVVNPGQGLYLIATGTTVDQNVGYYCNYQYDAGGLKSPKCPGNQANAWEDTSMGGCYSMLMISGNLVIGCTNSIVTAAPPGIYSSHYAITIIPVGAGSYVTSTYYSPLNLIYLGSTIGLGLEVDGTSYGIKRVCFLFSSTSGLSPFATVYYEEAPNIKQSPVFYWSTSDGQVARVNYRDFQVFSSGSTNNSQDYLASFFPIPGTNSLYYGVLNTTVQTTNDPNYFHTYTALKYSCSFYSSCSSCLATDYEYCGYCLSNGQCSDAAGCPSGDFVAASASAQCPIPISLSQTNGSTTGGANVVYHGTVFSNTSTYSCVWSDGITTKTIPSSGTTSTSVACTSPTWPYGASVSLSIWTAGIDSYLWSSGLNYTYYNCPDYSCSSCSLQTYPECGWCFSTATCNVQTSCASGWQRSGTCPLVGSVSPTSVSVSAASTTPVIVSISGFNVAPTAYCQFGTYGIVRSSSQTSSSVTCALPSSLYSVSSSVITNINITNGNGSIVYAGPSTGAIEVYNCSGFSICFKCTSSAYKCNWCSTQSCSESSCSISPCAGMTSITPAAVPVQSVSGTIVNITGTSLEGSTILDTCYWVDGSSHINTGLSIFSNTSATCIAPALTTATWELGLGNSIGIQTAQISFLVYNCSQYSSCDDCLGPELSGCHWCNDINGNLGCHEASDIVTCDFWLTDNITCPSISSTNPTVLSVQGNMSVYLYGNHNLSASDASSASCLFQLGSSYETAPLVYVNASVVECEDSPAEPAGAGSITIIGARGVAFTNSTPIEFASCDQYSTCSDCVGLQSFCIWCGGQCTSDCSTPSWAQLECPFFTSVSPSYSSTAGNQQITIRGGNFINVNSKKREAPSDKYIVSLMDNFHIDSKVAKKAMEETVAEKAVGLTGYYCNWGGSLNTKANVDPTGTQIFCQSPPLPGASSAPLTITFNGFPYLSTPGISYFTCPTIPSAYCLGACTSVAHCGWCVSSQSCNDQTTCTAITNNDVWQSGGCITASLNVNAAPVQGGATVVATLTGPNYIPAAITANSLSCVFGGVIVSASTINSGNDTIVTCVSPQVASDSLSSFGITYNGSQYMEPIEFTFIDCSIYSSSCTSCISHDGCGYCSSSGKCTTQSQCKVGWSTTKCPINKVALGVGLGVGLFAFILLLLLLAFLIRRLVQRKDGLVIAVREPNYAEIAWGSDTDLAWKIPEHQWKILEEALARRDFLLPLAIAFNCPATEQEALSKGLVYVASYHGLAAEMIQTCIRAEVMACQAENTLFRNNSVASKMYKFFSRIVGIKYLFNCIARVIAELQALAQRSMEFKEEQPVGQNRKSLTARQTVSSSSLLSVNMELDQTKSLDAGDMDTDTNLLQLELICQKILNVLTKTAVRNIPKDFRTIFVEIDTSVVAKFPGSSDAVYKGIGGMFFLRFVCPAITAPHVYGLLETPPNEVAQRQLVLISKVIQSIANMQEAGKKEEYMMAMSDFIVASIPKITKFYDNLRHAASLEGESSDEQVLTVPDNVRLNGIAAVWNFIYNQKEKIRKWSRDPDCQLDDMQRNDLVEILDALEKEYTSAPKKMRAGAASQSASAAAGKKK